MRKKLARLLIIVSCAAFFLFLFRNKEKRQEEREAMNFMVQEYIKKQEQTVSETAETKPAELNTEVTATEETQETKPEEKKPPVSLSYDGEIDSILNIPSIGLMQPVIRGNDEYNLEKKLLVCKGSLSGNYTVMGHNLYAGFVNFSSLHKLSIGDEVTLQSGETIMEYKVSEKYEALATDSEALFPQGEQNVLTLLTCTTRYRVEETKYLVIKCTKVGENVD